MVVIYWMIAFLVFLGVEAATTSLASIWFAGGALAALAAASMVVLLAWFLVFSGLGGPVQFVYSSF